MSILRITSTTIEAAATAEMLLERALGQRGKPKERLTLEAQLFQAWINVLCKTEKR